MTSRLPGAVAIALFASITAFASEVAKGRLEIVGLSLEVSRDPVITGVDIACSVQTVFGGKTNEQAPSMPGMSVTAQLTGPGILTPITLVTAPGHAFAVPALHEKGEYALQNIRLLGSGGEFLQQAVPSFAVIRVTDVLATEVRVRQLTADELRARGISLDAHYDVVEYEIVVGVEGGRQVVIPYPVIIDRRTHTIAPVARESPYSLPPLDANQKSPRFDPPSVFPLQLDEIGAGGSLPSGGAQGTDTAPKRPSIPAALVVPSGFGVLHQFFALVLQVSNSAPPEARIRLDSVTATIDAPLELRVSKVLPAVSLGQPVPIYDSVTGTTFLVAGAQGKAEWTLEALKAGTHAVDVEVHATYQNDGQPDIPLRGRVSTSFVVTDPRFQVNFSHPDVVRKSEPYVAYAFLRNLSPQRQHVVLDTTAIPACGSGAVAQNICRVDGDGTFELDLEAGAMTPVPYKLMSGVTGHVYAAAGSASDETLGVSVRLTMGVSESGIPLSPATLVMPHYAQYLPADLVEAQLQLLGLGYSLATAPLNAVTAKFPRVIKSDVFRCAQDIARAGQRVFITNPAPNRRAYVQLALDLLGNVERLDVRAGTPELREWDQLRRTEAAGRKAAAAIARQLEATASGLTPQQVADEFADTTSHRSPFFFAYAESGSMKVEGMSSGSTLQVASEATGPWVRTMPYGELTAFNGGQLAMIGRWTEDVRLTITPAAASSIVHLVWPDATDGVHRRQDMTLAGTAGTPISIEIRRGVGGSPIAQKVPNVVGAAQDLFLDPGGHIVSILFDRPVTGIDRDKLALTVNVPKASYAVVRRNVAGQELQIPGATMQADGTILNASFDKTLSRNAAYSIGVDGVATAIVPRIDNDRPGAILTGKVLRASGTAVAGAVVELSANDVRQLDLTTTDGRFMYEFVPRDIDSNITGQYALRCAAEGKLAALDGTVRLPGEVHTVNLVFLGRGSAQGQVRFNDGIPLPNVGVTVGSTLFGQFRSGQTDVNGRYTISDLPVGPLTFSVIDPAGRPTFAASQIRIAGEVVTQDLVIQRGDPPGLGTLRVRVYRSDTNALVAGAQVAIYSQGYGLADGYTDGAGAIEFARVPAGVVSVLAAEWAVSRESAAVEVDLKRDQVLDMTITLRVRQPADQAPSLIEGTVTRDDPSNANEPAKDVVVGGAVVSIQGLPPVTAAGDGTYAYPDVPLRASGRTITVFDPATGRRGAYTLPTLQSGSNHFSMRLATAAPEGLATMRVRLYDARGVPVAGYRVVSPGFPATEFDDKGNGIYELVNVRVPREDVVAAVPRSVDGPYGDQVAQGSIRVDFHGQIGILDLRLPGQGMVIGRLELEQACGAPPCYAQVIGPASITFRVWDEREQGLGARTIEVQPDASTGLVTFARVPARQDVIVETVRNPAGYAAAKAYLAYDGDARTVNLRMKGIGDVTGRVFSHDRQTPIPGATVRLEGAPVVYAPQLTSADGSFRFAGVAANVSFRAVAEYTRDGVFRTGYVDATTPSGGGPVGNLIVVMREQATVEGQVVDVAGVPVPLSRYWARELTWPYRTFGTAADPLQCDRSGRFSIGNVFAGPFRITAVSPAVQEIRGDYQGTIIEEGDVTQRSIRLAIGGGGVGAITLTVVDPLQAFVTVPNAEIALFHNGVRFDFTTTDENGAAYFESIPAGTYQLTAYSKARGRAGSTPDFTVAANRTTSHQIQLELRGTVTGRVTDPESDPPEGPVKGMPVTLDSRTTATRASTDGSGQFEFVGVPEGGFTLTAFDLNSGRIGRGPPNLFISSLVTTQKDVKIPLERFATLNVKAYLPNDTGGPGQLAPLIDAELVQKYVSYGAVFTTRGAQGPGEVTFPKLIPRYWYELTVRELGGEYRVARTSGTFETLNKTVTVVFPASGSVEVLVVDGQNTPVADAYVEINGRKVYTPQSGLVTLNGLPFGWISVFASKGNVSASAGAELMTRATPLRFTLNLGSRIAVAGRVEAEEGAGVPSTGTRVLMNVRSPAVTGGLLRLEAITDSAGNFRFSGVPVANTSLEMKFYGADDTTIGATYDQIVASGTTGTLAIPTQKLDATPPRVLSIDPPLNSMNVSPSTWLTITFTEPIAASFLSTSYFQLIATDDSSLVNVGFQPTVRPDGTYVVKLIPPPPPTGQKFALRSNVLYRFVVVQGVQDTAGHAMRNSVGTSFTTSDYAEPSVIRVDPPEDQPLPSNVTFRVKFNKPIDSTSFEAGNGGVLKLEKLNGYRGAVTESVPVARYLDPADGTTLVVAPSGAAIAESSFYRLTISGTRDTQSPPNVQREARTFDFFSYDSKRPVVQIVSPAAADKLVDGVLYTATVTIDDADVAAVDWFDASGKLLARVRTVPYAYSFVATGTSVTLRASATDLSGNTSETLASATWQVVPNNPPANVAVTNAPASLFPTGSLQTRVKFEDEGVSVSVTIELRGTRRSDGTAVSLLLGSRNVTRASTAVAFGDAVFDVVLPLDLKEGAAEIVATVTDSLSKSAVATGALAVLSDTIAPVVVSLSPKSETRYRFNQAYTVEFKVRDAETGVARAMLSVGGVEQTNVVSTFDAATGIRTYSKNIVVPPRNADTRVLITAIAYDNRDNVASATAEVVYERVDDASLPRAAWITPLDGAALPLGQTGWLTTLRVRATDDTKVTAVRFESAALPGPVTVTTPISGTADIFETRQALTMSADAASFTIRAIVSDGDPSHDVELPITIDPFVVAADAPAIVSANMSITANNAALYRDKALVVRGPDARIYVATPLQLKDLVLLDGALLSAIEETRVDLTISGRLFVDGDSRIDLTGRGYLGGWRTREDNGVTNNSAIGRTLSGSGARNASGSYGGLGGSFLGTTNATYGALDNPVDFGSGGAGAAGGSPGGNGGGAAAIRGGRFVIAGCVRTDGESGAHAAGSGGSVLLDSRILITGAATRITANGADDDSGANLDMGGGGGRIAIRVAERFDIDATAPVVQARGGRNLGGEVPSFVDGGAGTVLINDVLTVSNFDERYPWTSHRSGATPLASTLAFGGISLGPRALLRLDGTTTAVINAHPTSMVVGPGDQPTLSLAGTGGVNVPQYTNITARYSAASPSGVREVRTIMSAQPEDVTTYPGFVTATGETATSVLVPATALPGSATLALRVTDRAGRSVEVPSMFNIIANTPPVIDTFSVDPPNETFANRTIRVTATAHDDVNVTALTLISSVGAVSNFNVAIPPTTPSGTDITLTLVAADDFPGRSATTATKIIKVKKDLGPPLLAVVQPAMNAELQESANATFTVEANATDGEVGVKSVFARFEGVSYPLSPNAGRYVVAIPIPSVEGIDLVPKTLYVAATDYEGNATEIEVPVLIRPLIDPNAPELRWVCASPGSLYPAGYDVPIRFYAKGATAANAVQAVTITVNGNPLSAGVAGTDLYEAKFTIPGASPAGTVYNVRVAATSTASNESTLLGSFEVAGGIDVATASTIDATDLAFENRSLVVRAGGVLTIMGAHRLGTIVVLSGGRLVQRHTDLARADLLTVERLSVACGSVIDVSRLGYGNNQQPQGVGWADEWGGGSHVGRGVIVSRAAAGAHGSVYRPAEGGGSGHQTAGQPTIPGGGSVRIAATGTVVLDGVILATSGDRAGSGSAGAGGSVWLTAPALTGGGSIDVSGGAAEYQGAGGGGAIALEYGTASGSVLTNLRAFGGAATGSARPAAAGSIYLRGNAHTFGELSVVNNQNLTSATELPSFGRHSVASVSGVRATLAVADWLAPSLAGHWVRVIASDGTVRGTWRIAAIENDASSRTWSGSVELRLQDGVAYDGYIFYSHAGIGALQKRWVGARHRAGVWELDDDSGFTPFTPGVDERIVARFTKDATRITDLRKVSCCGAINGVPVLGIVAGELVANTAAGAAENGIADPSEIFIRPDGLGRGVILSATAPIVTLESGAVVQPGDVLQGVYRFDSVTLSNARLVTNDLVEFAQIKKDAISTLTAGNLSPPSLSGSFLLVRGLDGPVLVGSAGSATDADGVDLVARTTAVAPPLSFEAVSCVTIATARGITMRRVPNGRPAPCGATTNGTVDGVSFSAAQANKDIVVSAGASEIRLKSNGTYEIWASGVNANKTAAYTDATVFTMQRSSTSYRWIVDGLRVHEIAGAFSPSQVTFTFGGDAGALRDLDFDFAAFRAAGSGDGSFKLPLRAKPGQSVWIRSRDRHALFALESEDRLAAVIPPDFDIAGVTFAPAEVTGGRAVTGTVTLAGAAGPDGTRIDLASLSTDLTVPLSLIIPAGQTSGTFSAISRAVTNAVDARVEAAWGGVTAIGLVRIVKDTTPPDLAVLLPAANTQVTEGIANKIIVQATASDADSGVQRVFATIDGAVTQLSLSGGVWSGQVPAPYIDGTANVTKDLTVTAVDFNANAVTSAPIPIVIRPVTDATPPVIANACAVSRSLFPPGATATLRVTVRAGSAANPLHRVEISIAGVTSVATLVAVDTYELSYVVPDVPDGTVLAVRSTAVTASGATAFIEGTMVVVKDNVRTISSSAMISASDASYDGKTLIVTGGTVTIEGTHRFKRFVVIGGSVTHPQYSTASPQKIDLIADEVFVACGASIDATGRGFVGVSEGAGTTWPGLASSIGHSGGSHGGRGAASSGPAYGSVISPDTPGSAGGGFYIFPLTCSGCSAGGGVVKLDAAFVTVDGLVAADGVSSSEAAAGGAGGSINLNTTAFSGGGFLRASGGNWANSGGGGRIAVTYVTSLFDPSHIRAASHANNIRGSAGTIYLRAVDSSRVKISDELVVDDLGYATFVATPLPEIGRGTVSAVNGAIVTVPGPVPQWIEGAWVDFYNSGGARVASYEIASRTSTSITLRLTGNETTANVPVPGTYRGIWRFDAVTIRNTASLSADAIHTNTLTSSAGATLFARLLRGSDMRISGRTDVSEGIEADTLVLSSGAVATHPVTSGATVQRLSVRVAGALTIASGARIEVTGRGFAGASNGVGRTWPGVVGASGRGAASHGGRGGIVTGVSATAGETYGSLFEPESPGAAGSTDGAQSNCTACSPGGGVVRIDAASVQLDGVIRADGSWSGESTRPGAGGSISIHAGAISGTGEIHADGIASADSPSGGGRVAVHYSSLGLDRSRITAFGGASPNAGFRAAPGTIYLKHSTAPNGELIVSHSEPTAAVTPLPAVGYGIASAVTTDRITDNSAPFPPSTLSGIAVFVRDDMNLTWPIRGNDATTLTLDISQNSLTALPGDSYRGMSRFGLVKLRNANVVSRDVISTTTLDKDATSTITFNGGPPQFSAALRSQIVVTATGSGDFVTGPTGAVVDADVPIRIAATNTRTGVSSAANASADGSFSVPVSGVEGDTFTIRATDSHALPLSSAAIPVGGSLDDANFVVSLSMERSTLIGGSNVMATVRLQRPARAGGSVIALTSSSPSAASVPSSVVVPAGAIGTQFTVATANPGAATSVAIIATKRTSATAALTVLPAAAVLADLAIAPSSVAGGASANAVVTLGAPAPTGGAVVLLASSQPSIAAVPSSVVVSAGATSATATVTTSGVGATTNATINATYGATRSAAVTVTPCSTLGSVAPPQSVPSPLWLDDAPPSGTAAGAATFDTTQSATGTKSLHFDGAAGPRSWSVTGAAPFAVSPGDVIVAHALLNPCNPPRQLWLTLSDGTTALNASWGESLIDPKGIPMRMGALPSSGQWVRLEIPVSTAGSTATINLTSMQIQLFGGEAWIDAVGRASCSIPRAVAPLHRTDEIVWFDDALPLGAIVQAGGSARPWSWDSSQAASGTASHTDTLENGIHQHGFSGATEKLTASAGDILFAWVLIDPCNRPRQIEISFGSGGDWAHGAFWGENLMQPGVGIPQNALVGVLPEAGRWVRLEIPAGLINAEEVPLDGISLAAHGGRVWFDRIGKASRVNLARGKATTQSSTRVSNGVSYGPAYAADGDRSSLNDNWCTTYFENEPWWQVDLGSEQPIETIQIWPRTNCCTLSNFVVYVSSTPFAASRAEIDAQPDVIRLAFPGTASRPVTLGVRRNGRYVRVHRIGDAELQLAEVEVWAPLTAQRMNYATGRTSATQSSTQQPWGTAANAVNGDLSGSYATGGSTTHTNSESFARWEVDLGRSAPIDSIDVFLRSSTEPNPVAVADQITDFFVFVSDEPFASADPSTTSAQPGVSTYFYGAPARSSHAFPIGRSGRYVRVQLSSARYLFINEVQVWSGDLSLNALKKNEAGQ